MGCLFSSPAPKNEPVVEEGYSWDRERLDPKATPLTRTTLLTGLYGDWAKGRACRAGAREDQWPGICDRGMRGIAILTRHILQDCEIRVSDHMAQVTVDECKRCRLVLGPVAGSVFLRNCDGCVVIAACAQMRTRDCSKMTMFLHCTTQPSIETTSELQLACYQHTYPGLREHFDAAGLSVYNNDWSIVHNFTPDHGGWSFLPLDQKPSQFGISGDEVVPLTHGTRPLVKEERCFVVISTNISDSQLSQLWSSPTVLVRTRQSKATIEGIGMSGVVVGLELAGEGCGERASTAVKTMQLKEGIRITTDPAAVERETHAFFAPRTI